MTIEEVEIIKETTQDCLAQIKPTEWSEEDENKLNHILEIVHIASGSEASIDEKEELESFLKSLRPQPHWKPTEEQLKALQMVKDSHYFMYQQERIAIETLLKQLKSL